MACLCCYSQTVSMIAYVKMMGKTQLSRTVALGLRAKFNACFDALRFAAVCCLRQACS